MQSAKSSVDSMSMSFTGNLSLRDFGAIPRRPPGLPAFLTASTAAAWRASMDVDFPEPLPSAASAPRLGMTCSLPCGLDGGLDGGVF